jgi:translocation and assembly module TamA
MGILRRRAEEDIPQFVKVLHSAGYYEAGADFEIEDQGTVPSVTFHITTGERFRLESIEWLTEEKDSILRSKLPTPDALGLRPGDPAVAATILDGEKQLVQAIKREGFPFATVRQRRVVVDHATHTVHVTFELDPGLSARFGSTDIKGLKQVQETYVRGKLPWKQGDPFNADLLSEAETALTKTRLFGLVRITPGESLDADGGLPLTLEVRERKHRSVKIGAGYKTDEGPGGKFAWEHRNLFREGEKLQFELTASAITYAFDASFLKEGFLHPDQSLLISTKLADEDTDAFESRSLESAVALERKFGKTLKLGVRPAFRWSQVVQLDDHEEYALLSLPPQLEWDWSDDLLDPTRGGRLKAQIVPYWDTLGGDLAFAKTSFTASHYFRILESPLTVFALRAALGTTSFATGGPIPADLRYYAGGGGSVRGYAYQSAGPIAGKDHPLGGKSLIELGAEARVKITRNIGLVGFLDGGSAFESSYPDFQEDLLWGAGIGLRYHTPIGPLRLDVAVPLNRRPEIDDPFQVYVSIGQAF